MRTKAGDQMLAVWRYYEGGWSYLVAARNRKEAALFFSSPVAIHGITRVRGVYATGKAREL